MCAFHSVFSTTPSCIVFPCNDPAPTQPYTLSLHDALPISVDRVPRVDRSCEWRVLPPAHSEVVVHQYHNGRARPDRKSTRLNSSHLGISYAVFCLKKKRSKEFPPHPHICPPDSI